MHEHDAALLQGYLAGRDMPCPGCRYNLRDLRTSRCPECNQDLTLRVGLVEPATGAYLGTLVGLAVGAGASALLLAAITVISLIHRWPRRDEEFAIIVLYPLGVLSVLGGALCWLVRDRGRRWFIARTSRQRRLLALGSGCLTLGVFGIWLFLVLNYT